jgi:uncharacterized membrane protein YkvA (DUF1232 family)
MAWQAILNLLDKWLQMQQGSPYRRRLMLIFAYLYVVLVPMEQANLCDPLL